MEAETKAKAEAAEAADAADATERGAGLANKSVAAGGAEVGMGAGVAARGTKVGSNWLTVCSW